MIFLISFNLNKQITIKRKIQQKSPDPDPDRFLPENVNNFVRSKFCSLHSLVNFSLLLNNTIIQRCVMQYIFLLNHLWHAALYYLYTCIVCLPTMSKRTTVTHLIFPGIKL